MDFKQIEDHLGFELSDEIKNKLIEDDITDLNTFIASQDKLNYITNIIQPNQIDHNETVIDSDKFQDELNKIGQYLKDINVTFSDKSKQKLKEFKVDFKKFLTLNDAELQQLEFSIGSREKICLDRDLKIFQKKVKIIKTGAVFQHQPQSDKTMNKIESQFSNIILDKMDRQVLLRAVNCNAEICLATILKPYLFDLLKRNKKLNDILVELNYLTSDENFSITPEDRSALEMLSERDLVVCLVESVHDVSLPRLGNLIAKNDYPLPLTYFVYNEDDNNNCKLDYKINFKLFYDVLCLTRRSLAVIAGTESTFNCGKSRLIPLLFEGLNQESVYCINHRARGMNTVDILCNEETNENWIVADFNGSISSSKREIDLNLFKTFAAFSSIVVLNAKTSDFKANGEAGKEIKTLFDWFNEAKLSISVVVLLRDANNVNKQRSDMIRSSLSQLYGQAELMIVRNMNEMTVEANQLKAIQTEFAKEFAELRTTIKPKSFRSIFDIKTFLDELNQHTDRIPLPQHIESKVVINFNRIFAYRNDQEKLQLLNSIFELSNLYKKIAEIESKLRVNSQNIQKLEQKIVKNLETELSTLKRESMTKIKPMNQYLKFFIDLVLNLNDDYVDLLMFEKCLLDFKKADVEKLRRDRKILTKEYGNLDEKLKNLTEKDLENNQNKLNKKHKLEMENRLKEIDEKIYMFDLTIDKFWDEIFLYFEWLHETKQTEQAGDSKLREKLVEAYVYLLDKGFSIHLLRGNPLSIKTNLLADIFKRLPNYNNIYVISVIGEQSSAKSSLMNALFGCDFRTSAGRCTLGIYMNFVQCGDKTLVVLDTEGLAAVESSSKLFDNQMATMSVFSSHLIIINHKGEISSNLENILGITFFARVKFLKKSPFKPSILFVLRDQIETQKQDAIVLQADKLKEKLIKQARWIDDSLNDVINIESDVCLLNSAFSIDEYVAGKITWRNKIFPNQILELRKRLFDYLTHSNMGKYHIDSMANFYDVMCSHWTTIRNVGDNILKCKDLEEIKIREEISLKATNAIDKHKDHFNNGMELILKELNQTATGTATNNAEFNVEIVKQRLKTFYQDTLNKILAEYDKDTDVSYYSVSVKKEFRKRIEYEYQWLKDVYMSKLDNDSIKIKNKSALNELMTRLAGEISHLLRNNANISQQQFEQLIKTKLKAVDSACEHELKLLQVPVEMLISNCENYYNQIVNMISTRRNVQFPFIFHLYDFFYDRNYNMENWLTTKGKVIHKGHEIKDWVTASNTASSSTNKILDIHETVILANFPHISSRHISTDLIYDLIELVYKSILSSRLSVEFANVFGDFMRLSLCIMIDRILDLQNRNLASERDKYDIIKVELETQAHEIFKNKNNSIVLGANSAKAFINIFAELFAESELNAIDEKNNRYIQNQFKSPSDLVDFAFKRSFEIADYKSVYKYVKDINRFCLEVCMNSIKTQIDMNIEEYENLFRRKFVDILNILSDMRKDELDYNNNFVETAAVKYSIHLFLDDLRELIRENFHNETFTDLLESAKLKMINNEFNDKKLFIDGFVNGVNEEKKNIDARMRDYSRKFRNDVQEHVKKYVNIYLGCNAICPGCGSKCQNKKGHDGDHFSSKHIYDGFNGWSYIDSDEVTTFFCWEDKKYRELKVILKDRSVEYENFQDYLRKKHPDWVNNVDENHKKYAGDNKENAESIKFKRDVQKAWMNIRKAILKDRVDRKYDESWLNLEESENMLCEDHKPDWEYSFD